MAQHCIQPQVSERLSALHTQSRNEPSAAKLDAQFVSAPVPRSPSFSACLFVCLPASVFFFSLSLFFCFSVFLSSCFSLVLLFCVCLVSPKMSVSLPVSDPVSVIRTSTISVCCFCVFLGLPCLMRARPRFRCQSLAAFSFFKTAKPRR